MHYTKENFDEKYYFFTNPDFQDGIKCWEHWQNYGKPEGRCFCYKKDLTHKRRFKLLDINREMDIIGTEWRNYSDLTLLRNPYYFRPELHSREYLPYCYYVSLYNFYYENKPYVPNIPQKDNIIELIKKQYHAFTDLMKNGNVLVAISHVGGGGTEKYLYYNLQEEFPNHFILVLKPLKGNLYLLHSLSGKKWNMDTECFVYDIQIPFHLPSQLLALKNIMSLLNVERLFINHLGSWGKEIQEIVKWYPYDMMIHDYGYICRKPNPILHEFEDELSKFKQESYFEFCFSLIHNAKKVLLPSYFLKNVYQKLIPADYHVKYHKDRFPLFKDVILRPVEDKLRVAIIGEFSERKGSKLVEQIIALNDDMTFHLVGENSDSLKSYHNAISYGRYDECRILDIITLLNPNVILYCSIFHETFCYTLSYALHKKIPIISTRMGSIPERVNGRFFTWLFDPSEIVDKFRNTALLLKGYCKYMHSTDFKDYSFDWKYYLYCNPDLLRNDIDTKEKAWQHFITHGYKENRYGSFKKWSTKYHFSLDNFEGTEKEFLEWNGSKRYEGISFPFIDNKVIEDNESYFDAKKYIRENPDLLNLLERNAWNHWVNYGKYENRMFPINDQVQITIHIEPKVAVINFPQFHQDEINDKVWFPGWTDFSWLMDMENIIEGENMIKPQNGEYDYTSLEARQKDTHLFKKYDIDIMMYYHYYFDGKIILDKPLLAMLNDGHPDTKFIFCWANETWSRRWDINSSSEIILQQTYSPNFWSKHVKYLSQFFCHPNYYKCGNSPYFVIAISNEVMGSNEGRRMIQFYRTEIKKYGLDDIIFIQLLNLYDKSNGFYKYGKTERQPDFLNNVWCQDPQFTKYNYSRIRNKARIMNEYNEEKYLIYNPDIREAIAKGHLKNGKEHYDVISEDEKLTRSIRINLYDVEEVWKQIALNNDYYHSQKHWFGTYAGWNNCPRILGCENFLKRSIPSRPNVHIGVTPYGFYRSIVKTMQKYLYNHNDPVVVINAWNEWGEGNAIEPSDVHGEKLCLAIKLAKNNFRKLCYLQKPLIMSEIPGNEDAIYLSKVNENLYRISLSEYSYIPEFGCNVYDGEMFFYLPEEITMVMSFMNQYATSRQDYINNRITSYLSS